jgi:hypothetical protein
MLKLPIVVLVVNFMLHWLHENIVSKNLRGGILIRMGSCSFWKETKPARMLDKAMETEICVTVEETRERTLTAKRPKYL